MDQYLFVRVLKWPLLRSKWFESEKLVNQKLTFKIKDFGFKIVHFLDQSNLPLISNKNITNLHK